MRGRRGKSVFHSHHIVRISFLYISPWRGCPEKKSEISSFTQPKYLNQLLWMFGSFYRFLSRSKTVELLQPIMRINTLPRSARGHASSFFISIWINHILHTFKSVYGICSTYTQYYLQYNRHSTLCTKETLKCQWRPTCSVFYFS